MIYRLSDKNQEILNVYIRYKKSKYRSFARFLYDLENNYIKKCASCKKEVLLLVDYEGTKICSKCNYLKGVQE